MCAASTLEGLVPKTTKPDAFFNSAAYVLPAEFTVMECSLLCLQTAYYRGHDGDDSQSPFSPLSLPHTLLFMSLIDP